MGIEKNLLSALTNPDQPPISGPTPEANDPGLTFAPFESDEIGRRFERAAIPVSMSRGLGLIGEKQILFNNSISNLAAFGVEEYDKRFNPAAASALKDFVKQKKLDLNNEISRMPSGFFPDTAKIGMATLSSLADPLQAAAAVFAPETIGTKALSVVGALSERAAFSPRIISGAVRGARGAISGAAFGTVQSGAHLAAARSFNDDYNSLDALKNIGTYAALGAGLEGLVGLIHIDPKINPVEPISIQDHRQILEAATGQLGSDNYPDLNPLVKTGVENMQIDESPVKIAEIENNIPKIQKQLARKSNSLKASKDSFDKNISSFKTQRGEFPIENINSVEMAERIEGINKKISAREPLSDYEKFQKKTYEKIPSVKKSLDLIKKSPLQWTDNDLRFMTDVRNGKESDLLTQENKQLSKVVKDNQDKINAGQKSISVTIKNGTLPETKTQLSFDDIRKIMSDNEKRISQIKKSSKDKDILDLTDQSNKIDKKAADVGSTQENLKNNQTGLDVLTRRNPPLTGTEVKSMAAKMLSADNEQPLITQDDSLTKEVGREGDVPDTLLKEDEDKVKQLISDGKLTDDEVDLINTVDDELKSQEGYTKLISQIVGCVAEDTI